MGQEIAMVDLRPGQAVELPGAMVVGTSAASVEAPVAIFSGIETTVGKVFYPYFNIPNPTQPGEYMRFALRAMPGDTKFALAEGVAVTKLIEPIKIAMREEAKLKLLNPRSLISGCDPEMFVVRKDGKTVIPAWEFLEDKPTSILKTKMLHPPVFWDGFQAEWCPLAKGCLQELMDSVRLGMVNLLAAARLKDEGAKLSVQSTVEIEKATLETAAKDFVAFRCTPSFNVYRDPGAEAPDPREYTRRYAGGHLHAGISRMSDPVLEIIIKALDAVVGVAGVSLAASIDTPLRREMYGRAGEFRLPEHGIEYRVLSNFWLCAPPISHLVFELFRETIRLAESGLFSLCWESNDDEVRSVINNCDVIGARKMLRTNEHVVYAMLKKKFHGTFADHMKGGSLDKVADMALVTIQNGVETAIKDPLAIEKNWHLTDGMWNAYGTLKGGMWRNAL